MCVYLVFGQQLCEHAFTHCAAFARKAIRFAELQHLGQFTAPRQALGTPAEDMPRPGPEIWPSGIYRGVRRRGEAANPPCSSLAILGNEVGEVGSVLPRHLSVLNEEYVLSIAHCVIREIEASHDHGVVGEHELVVHEIVGLLRLAKLEWYRVLACKSVRYLLPGIDLVGSNMGCAPLPLNLVHLRAVI